MIKRMAYLAVLASLIGANTISLDLSVIQLSIFRGIIILMVFAIIQNAFSKNTRISLGTNKENSYSLKVMLIWLAYAIITLCWVEDFVSWFKAVFFIGIGVMCIIMCCKAFKKSSQILTCFRIMTVMILLHNLIGWYEINTGNYIFLTTTERIEQFMRAGYPVSIFGNPNNFATFLMISIFITYICAANSKRIIGKCIYAAIMISSILLIFMASSRANILGVSIGLALFTILSTQNIKRRRTMLFILIALLIAILFAALLMPEVFINLFFNTSDSFDRSDSDMVRMNLLLNGLSFLFSTFGFGTGAGNIEYWMGNYGIHYTFGITNIHNWWMEILVGYGLIIFGLYVSFYLRLFRSLYIKFTTAKNEVDITISLGLMCCMTGFVIGCISSSSNMESEWLWVFWGIVIAYQGVADGTTIRATEQLRK